MSKFHETWLGPLTLADTKYICKQNVYIVLVFACTKFYISILC